MARRLVHVGEVPLSRFGPEIGREEPSAWGGGHLVCLQRCP